MEITIQFHTGRQFEENSTIVDRMSAAGFNAIGLSRRHADYSVQVETTLEQLPKVVAEFKSIVGGNRK